MRFGILGPLEMHGAGGPVEVRGPKRRGLLALLLVHANQRLSVDRIVDALWADEAVPGAVRTVQTYISQLRGLFDDPALGVHRQEGAYTLELPADALDADRFERLVHESATVRDAATRLELLDEALGLFRGSPLEEFADAAWAAPERTRLELARLGAIERRVDASFELGRHREVIADLEALVDEAPLDERLWGRLLLAYYGAGRQGDALRAYQRARSVLADQLGIEPGAELVELERRILDQDPTLGATGGGGDAVTATGPEPATGEALPDGVSTFLMTDVEDSTRLWDDHPDAMAGAMARHEELVATAVHGNRGRLVKSRGEGDGTLSVFARASDAVAAAVDLQRAILAEPWPDALELATRIGIHTGEAHRRDGDYFGGTLNRAARIRALAAGGQILCSAVTAALVDQRLPERVTIGVVGTRALRGLRRPETIHEVVHPDLARPGSTTPAPAGALGAPVRSLPPPLQRILATELVGRTRELAQLDERWRAAAAGSVQLVFVSGEPGVGKTRLAAELARRLHEEGAGVLFGHCDEEIAVPYQPFAEAVRGTVVERSDDELAADLGPYPALAHLLPELPELVPAIAAPVRADPETERYQLFEAVGSFLDALGRRQPVLVVLDDLHWAAEPTLLLLRHLARRASSSPVLVVATYRDTELHRRHPLAASLANLRREELGERVVLRGLDEDDVARFVAHMASGEADRDDVTALAHVVHLETEGNPFFVGQVLRHLVESGAVARRDGRWVLTAALGDVGLPEGIREVVSRRLAVLDDLANDVLAVASVVGREFDAELVGGAGGFAFDDVLDALDAAATSRLVEPVSGGTRFAFVHALVRSVLYEAIPTTRRLRLHRDVADGLVAADDDELVAEIARHACEAAALGGVDQAVAATMRAAARARRQLAFEEAATLYERALGVLEPASAPEREHRGELLVELARVTWDAGDRERARRYRREAADHARATGDAEVLGRAVLSEYPHANMGSGQVDAERVRLGEDALEALPTEDSSLRAMVTARLAGDLLFEPDAFARRSVLAADALAMARRLEDPRTIAYVLGAVQGAVSGPEGVRRWLDALEETLDHARQLGERELEFIALRDAASALVRLGEVERADEMLEAEARVATELQRPLYRYYSLMDRAGRALMRAELDEAAALAQQGLAHAHDAGNEWMGLNAFAMIQFDLVRARGEDAELDALGAGVDALVEHFRDVWVWRVGHALHRVLVGRAGEARATFEPVVDDLDSYPADGMLPIGVAVLIDVAVHLGDAERAERLHAALEPYRDQLVSVGGVPHAVGSAELYLALAAGTAGRLDAAEAHYARAEAMHHRTGCRLWSVNGALEYATVLARQGGDPDRIHALLADCIAEARSLGMTRTARLAECLAAEVRPGAFGGSGARP